MMKQLLILTIFMFLSLLGFSENKILFVNLTDGSQNLFTFNEIDSITYSREGRDGNIYSEFKTQKIWTGDTVYNFAIDEIAEVGFQTPEPVVKSNVIDLSSVNIDPYIIKSEGTDIIMKESTPEEIVPQEGWGVYAIYPSQKIPYGFIGKVSSKEYKDGKLILHCDYADLNELFDSFYAVIETEREDVLNQDRLTDDIEVESIKSSSLIKSRASEPLTITFPLSEDINNEIGKNIKFISELSPKNVQLSGSVSIKFKGEAIQGVTPDKKNYQRFILNATIPYSMGISWRGKANIEKEFWHFSSIPFPMGLGFMADWPLSFFFNAGMEGAVEYNYENEMTASRTLEVVYNKWGIVPEIKYNESINFGKGNHSLNFYLGGSASFGIRFKPRIKWINEKVANFNFHTDFGYELSAAMNVNELPLGFAESQYDTEFYERVKDYWTLGGHFFIAAEAEASIGSFKKTIWDAKYNLEAASFEVGWLPKFENLKVTRSNNNSIFTYTVNGGLFIPQTIGIILDHEENVEFFPFERKHSIFNINDEIEFQVNLPKDENFSVWPYIELWPGKIVRATPKWPFTDTTLYPFIFNTSTSQQKYRVTGGAISIKDGYSDKVIIQEGQPFPFNNY